MILPSWINKLFQKTKESENTLEVYFDATLIGSLRLKEGFFIFNYDENCPESLKIRGMEEKTVKSRHLLPFFSARLPSKTRPEIFEELEKIGSDDPLLILGKLSSKSALSPYKFKLKVG